jgi:16S rRNA (adenine1518-N6/adenine1519-N6)-dimethyltransferase
LIVLTIQKEVAERICAFKKSHMNLLAASVQFWAKPEIVGYVSRKDFKPMPQVDSAIIKLISKNQKPKDKSYYSFIKILFKQPRKTILNNLLESRSKNQEARKEIISKLLKIRINPQKRPQDLNINQIQKLSKLFNYNS